MSEESNRAVIAQRELTDRKNNETVRVAVFAPVRVSGVGEDEKWCCELEVTSESIGEASAYRAYGVDSLQALVNSIAYLRNHFRTNPARYQWLDEPGELGFPALIQGHNRTFLELAEHLIDAEHCRQALLYQTLEKLGSDP